MYHLLTLLTPLDSCLKKLITLFYSVNIHFRRLYTACKGINVLNRHANKSKHCTKVCMYVVASIRLHYVQYKLQFISLQFAAQSILLERCAPGRRTSRECNFDCNRAIRRHTLVANINCQLAPHSPTDTVQWIMWPGFSKTIAPFQYRMQIENNLT